MFGPSCNQGRIVGGKLGGLLKIRGLTFFKDYTNGGSLNADYSVGNGIATFTNGASNVPTFNGGISMTSAGVDVLKYQTLGNRTAAQETIVIKFAPTGDFANDGVYRIISSTDTKTRQIRKDDTGTVVKFIPNNTDSPTSNPVTTTTPLDGVSYVSTLICKKTSPYALNYLDGVLEGSDTDNFTNNAWGTYFYIGCAVSGDLQLNGIIHKVAFFNRALSQSEVATVTNLM